MGRMSDRVLLWLDLDAPLWLPTYHLTLVICRLTGGHDASDDGYGTMACSRCCNAL